MKTYYGKYKGKGRSWHVIYAKSELEAKAKMLKGTKYTFSEITITTKKPASIR